MKEITVEEFRASRSGNAAQWQWVDVRSANEYAAGHVPGAVNIPLEQIAARLDDVSASAPVVLICKSGTRAGIAAGLLKQWRENVMVLNGGTEAWAEAGLPLVVNRATRWSLERQVRLAAGLIVMAGVMLAATVNSRWMYLSGFVGLGLTFAGLTDICAMGALLAKMPWNRTRICAVPAGRGSAGGGKVAGAIAGRWREAVTVVRGITSGSSDERNNSAVNFETLANEHKDAVYRQMIRVCGNREDAEDVLVEALLKAYRHVDQLRESQAFRGWLAQIARRVCWRLKEREALLPLMQLSELEEEGSEIPSNEAPAEHREALREMKELLRATTGKLPEEYRAVYQLRDVEGLAGDVVAKELGISLAAMKSRLHRARELVRDGLDQALLGKNTRHKEIESRSGAAK